MRANESIPLLAVEAVRRSGHDVFRARTGMSGAGNLTVLGRARAEGRLLVTFDKSELEPALGRRLRPCPLARARKQNGKQGKPARQAEGDQGVPVPLFPHRIKTWPQDRVTDPARPGARRV